MKQVKTYSGIYVIAICLFYTSCKTLAPVPKMDLKPMPAAYTSTSDTSNSAEVKWKDFFSDANLVSLIDTALKNNLDVLTTFQEIEIARNNVNFRKGMLFPSITANGAAGLEKVGRYTSQGAGDASAEIRPGQIVPELLPDYFIGLRTSWEVDVWGKLRNAKKAAFAKYLSSIEGRNFVITNLIAEVANSYYELLSLDSQLDIVRETIQLQKNGLEIVKIQKQAAIVTELAVKQFEATVLNSQSMEFEILQKITENENRINFLMGRYPQPISRDKSTFMGQIPLQVKVGIPSQLLKNRPDIKQAELELIATKCDVKAARAEFYPSLDITGAIGFQAFKTGYLFTSPQSLAYSLIGDLAAPLINRTAIKAEFNKAKAVQIEAMYDYQKAILDGYVEVSNELSNITNLEKAYNLKSQEVETLTASIDISNDLFKSAKANYLEVLTTQREALQSKLELVDTKKQQYNSILNVYKALGGGWR